MSPSPRRRGRPATLSRGRVVSVAVELTRAEGFEALTVRRLADAVGAGATSLYTYVRDKDDLVDLVIDELVGFMTVPSRGAPARRLVGWAESARAVMTAHPGMAEVILARTAIGPNALAMAESVLEVLEAAGVPPRRHMDAYQTLLVYINGFVITTVAARRATSPEHHARVAKVLADIQPASTPRLAAALARAGRGEDSRFRAGLVALVAGLAREQP